MDRKSNKIKSIASDALIIAAFPVVAYTLKFIFDAGYYSFYDIPNEINSFSISAVLSSFVIILAASFFILIQVGANINTKRPTDVVDMVLTNIGIVIVSLFISLLFQDDTRLFTVVFSVIALWCAFTLALPPIFDKKKNGNYRERLRKHIEKAYRKRTEQNETITDYIYSFMFYRISFLVILLVSILFSVHAFGYTHAKMKEEYYTLSNDNTWIVVKFIDEQAVLSKVENGYITHQFKIINSSDELYGFTKRQTGVLKN